ncbi:hypothetical protein DOTSEDRAFT_72943 [Dothistroma septosporum NZE10]|uniref:SET domain-containing protein n=1 Tax=Dothistroma septosporum (strain NZE10 / CBS 128990) TaxID=675120 RepID=N1PKC4_DOTSN|nr:hypothetical protein DOTSEDRAFT_72943 [Dothistroma septosporum NZE10]
MTSNHDGRLYTLQIIPGKGKGLVASRKIAPGTLIINEPALFTTESLQNAETIEKDLAALVKALPKDSQRAILSLHNNFPGANPFSNIIRSNGYPLGPSSDIGGVFPETARINHSCRANAQHAWNEKLQRMLVHAVREIAEGEELTLSYIIGGPSEERRSNLKNLFTFDCGCELCSLPKDQLKQSDERLRRAQCLDEAIGDAKVVRQTPERALEDCRALLQIYQEEQIYDLRLPRLYYDAFQICAMHGDRARAAIFARRARETRVNCEGAESTEAERLHVLAQDPTKYENAGVTSKWKSKIADVPQESDGFEKWLWRQCL